MNEYVIAKYIRLSIEDDKTESMSIPHQQLILDRHIDELEIPNATVLEFIDNGHTGKNMERPAVQEMLDLVRSGRVHCIAVKDFSRFSRNAMDSGYFIEQVFPLYQVRFISVADHFDSNDYINDTGGIDVAFKFLMHEYYSEDLSKKVSSAMRLKMRNGEYFSKRRIYGYERTDDRRLIPNEPAASVVRQIFALALSGKNTSMIRDILSAERIPTPSQYLAAQHNMNTWQSEIWTARMVLTILKNVQYTGCYVSGKQTIKAVGSSSKNWVDESEWITIPDSHPPLVSKEDFEAVQALLSRFKNSITEKPVNNPLYSDTKSPRLTRMANGEQKANNPVYGYSKGENGTLVIDPAATAVIQEMYQLAARGLSVKKIRDKLTEACYPIPAEHIKLGKSHDITPSCRWTDKCVRGILQNVQYTGAYVAGKYLKNFETGRIYHTAQSDWVIIPDKHPAIVSKELFGEVQETFTSNREKRRNQKPRGYLLRGSIVKCGCCGYTMPYDGSTAMGIYRCNHTLADRDAKCHRMKVEAAQLDRAVLTMIRKQAEVVLNNGELSGLRKVASDETRVAQYENEIRLCVEQRQQAYERFVLREIDKETYQALKDDCTAKIERVYEYLSIMRQAERDRHAGVKSAEIAKRALSESVTPREIVETLIDKIFVFPGKRIEVQWKIADFTRAI